MGAAGLGLSPAGLALSAAPSQMDTDDLFWFCAFMSILAEPLFTFATASKYRGVTIAPNALAPERTTLVFGVVDVGHPSAMR